MDLSHVPELEFPTSHTTIRKEAIFFIGMVGVLVGLAIGAVLYRLGSDSGRTAEAKLAHQITLRNAAVAPKPVPDPDAWDEDRDGNNALDIEDTNGQGTIFVDSPTKTRILCVSGSSCIKLPNPKLSPAPATPSQASTKH